MIRVLDFGPILTKQQLKIIKSILFLSMSNHLPCTMFLKYTVREIKGHMTIQFFGKLMNGNRNGGKLGYM